MRAIPAFVLFCLGGAGAAVLAPQNAAEDLYKLPAKLMIGAGLSSSQSEGAWDTDGKSESVLDHLAHLKPSPFPATIDVAADHYHLYISPVLYLLVPNLSRGELLKTKSRGC
ncbi:hypothetical protein FOCC_FOCC015187 [Frankliniella occidentalis]|nr:hypothetical protein FOCC_FOCC015187 [Frankliniella occidentalis]